MSGCCVDVVDGFFVDVDGFFVVDVDGCVGHHVENVDCCVAVSVTPLSSGATAEFQ